ncbi:MAG: hypothetical protein IGBAC_1327 [Ignavibacteriae bacterium]|nr:MAG: hypothetical protein IGBAC_1327 [Ignavibacteriota bacterium]
MKKNIFIVITTVLTLLSSSIYGQDKIKLEYKFEKGKTYLYKDETVGDMTQEMMGREMKMKNESKSLVRLVVDNVDKDNKATLIVSSDSVTVHSKTPMRDTTISVKEIEGKRTKIVVSKLGKIFGRETIDSIKVSGRMSAMANREAISFPQFPENAIAVGEKWKSTEVDTTSPDNSGQLIVTRDIEYTLAGKEKKNNYDCFKVTFTGTSSTEGKFNMQGMEFYIEGSGKVKGSFYFATKIGMVIESESETESEMTYASVGENPMTIPITQKIVSKRTLVK